MKTPWAAALGIGAVVAVLILFWPASGSPATASPPDGIWSPPVFGRVPQADKPPSEATNRLPLVAPLWGSGTDATSSSLTETHAYAGPVVLNLVGQIGGPAMAVAVSGLFAIDVSSLTAPTLAGNYDTPDWAWGVALSGTTKYVADVSFGSGIPELMRGALYLPALHLVAYYRSMSKGLDPDQPHNLSKVIELDSV
jgi:hypothetical protein